MTVEDAGQHGPGIRDLAVLKELQGLKVSVGNGAAADTNIAIAGINLVDTLVAVLQIHGTTVGQFMSRTSTSTITSAGNIQSTVGTGAGLTGNIIAVWFDKDPDD